MEMNDPKLLHMPDLVMKNILRSSGLRSILVLRKVCRDLRNYIDDVEPEISLESLEISVGSTKQGTKEIVLGITSFNEHHTVYFRKHFGGCQVVYGKKKKLVQNLDYHSAFLRELDFILERHKSVLKIFRVNMSSNTSDFWGSFVTNLNARKKQLQVKYFSVKAERHQALQLLSSVSSKILKRIELCLTKPEVVNAEEFAVFEHWHGAEELFTEGLTILGPVNHFGHFSRAEVTLFRVTVEGLFWLKEKFLESPNFKHFIIHYRHFADEEASDLRLRIVETRKLVEFFGAPFLDDNAIKEKHWYFGISTSNYDTLFFSFSFRCSTFARVPLSSVPQGAV